MAYVVALYSEQVRLCVCFHILASFLFELHEFVCSSMIVYVCLPRCVYQNVAAYTYALIRFTQRVLTQQLEEQ